MAVHPSQAGSAVAPAAAAAIGINPLVGMGVGLGTDLINQMVQGISNRRQNKRMVDFWKMNNEYNHPSSQMARLRQAGLNPNLIYGSNAAGAAGNATAPKPFEYTPPQVSNPIAEYQNVKLFNLQSDNLRAANTLKEQQTAQSAAATALTGMKEAQSKLDFQRANELYQTSIDAARANLENVQRRNTRQMLDNFRISETNANRILLIQEELTAKRAQIQYMEAGTALRLLEKQLKQEGIENAPFWARWLYRNVFQDNKVQFDESGEYRFKQ